MNKLLIPLSVIFVLHVPTLTVCQLFSDVQQHQQDRLPSGTVLHSHLPPSGSNGAVKRDGTDIDNLSDKLIQRITSTGSNYYLVENGNGKPLYRRHEIDTNRDFVVFPDPNYDPGDGHYVVLRRLFVHNTMTPYHEPTYQGFYLVFSDSVHAFMRKWEPPTTTPSPQKKKVIDAERHRKEQPSFQIEFGEAVDFGDMVRREKRGLDAKGRAELNNNNAPLNFWTVFSRAQRRS